MMTMACDGGVCHGGCGDGRVELGFVSWCGVSHSLQPLYTLLLRSQDNIFRST